MRLNCVIPGKKSISSFVAFRPELYQIDLLSSPCKSGWPETVDHFETPSDRKPRTSKGAVIARLVPPPTASPPTESTPPQFHVVKRQLQPNGVLRETFLLLLETALRTNKYKDFQGAQ